MLYPIGIQSFEAIRQGRYVYVDKTDHIWRLATTGQCYFLSRPRRFGKSLLVSAMEAYFSGEKELFDGLKIAELEKDWIQYPVLHLDFSAEDYSDIDSLTSVISEQLKKWELQYGVTDVASTISSRFKNIVDAAWAQTSLPVVLLVDEYDKPIIDNLGNEEVADAHRKKLKSFYEVVKNKNKYFKFAFFTGVTRIGKLSIFSGLNNLKDISMDARFTDICGISGKDLKAYFNESIKELALANSLTEAECYSQLALMYDGYHFCEDTEGVYNPFSVLSTLDSLKFKEYWIETGTPSFLVEVMKRTDYDVTGIASEEADSSLLADIDTAFYNPVPLLYQSGYLTIKDYDKTTGIYTLGFPNLEVKHGFLSFLLSYYTSAKGSGNLLIRQMSNDLLTGQPADFMKRMEAFFAKQNYQIQGNAEKDFQYAMSIILQLLSDSVEVHTEDTTSEGRMDILVETPRFIYIIEIKINDSAEAALQQIQDKGYARKFADDNRKLFKIGVRFSTDSRCIDSWKVVE
ncbi:MAG: AAA family ATPase [Bacteroidales bacterium]|nr:AAA family ATPase [Bacteroidales bacterium]